MAGRSPKVPATDCGFVNPIYTYPHTAAGQCRVDHRPSWSTPAMTFGEDYQNKVFIADYTLGWIKELTFDSELHQFISEKMFDDRPARRQAAPGTGRQHLSADIYPGELSVIAPSGGNRAPKAVITATPSNGLCTADGRLFIGRVRAIPTRAPR